MHKGQEFFYLESRLANTYLLDYKKIREVDFSQNYIEGKLIVKDILDREVVFFNERAGELVVFQTSQFKNDSLQNNSLIITTEEITEDVFLEMKNNELTKLNEMKSKWLMKHDQLVLLNKELKEQGSFIPQLNDELEALNLVGEGSFSVSSYLSIEDERPFLDVIKINYSLKNNEVLIFEELNKNFYGSVSCKEDNFVILESEGHCHIKSIFGEVIFFDIELGSSLKESLTSSLFNLNEIIINNVLEIIEHIEKIEDGLISLDKENLQ